MGRRAADGWGVVGGGGAVRFNRPAGVAPDGESVEFRDVIRVGGVLPREALLTAFVADLEWVAAEFGPACSTVLVRHYDPRQEPAGAATVCRGLRVVNPPALGEIAPFQPFPPNLHSKLMVLRFDDRVRVVVSSANLQPADWECVGQVIWAADFPLTDTLLDDTPFARQLCFFLSRLLPDPADALYWTSGYSAVSARAHLVPSVPGGRTRLPRAAHASGSSPNSSALT